MVFVTDQPGLPCDGRAFFIPGPAGRLEALAACPPAPAARATAIVCHPHPQHGGTMHNKVVHTLARAFQALGLHALRFNFRGTGASAGGFDHGNGETEDLLAVLGWVRARRPGDEIWLAGFSFGAYVALRASVRAALARLVTVAPAVNLYRVDAAPRVPWLLIQGEDDEVVPASAVTAWVAGLGAPPELVLLPGTGHYFHGRLAELRQLVETRLGAHVPRA
jgi:hypothetical protein